MDPKLAGLARSQMGAITTAQLVRHGYNSAEITRLVRNGVLLPLRRGAYASRDWFELQSPALQHLAHARAAQLKLNPQPVLSHRTAAIAHGLPLIGSPPQLPELTSLREERRQARSAHLYAGRLHAGHTTVIDDAEVTTVVRTISDVAREHSAIHAVVMGDFAVRQGLATPEEAARLVADCWTWRGIARTKRVFGMLDGASESPGESISRVRMIEHNVPAPILQYELDVEGRRFRSDFAWPARKVIGEFDGRVKYGNAADLFEEKRREDALRRAGWRVERWVWDELWGETPAFIPRIRAALRS